jgi:hypothetical protein
MTAADRTQPLNLVGWVLNPRVALWMYLHAWVKDPPYMLSPVGASLEERR